MRVAKLVHYLSADAINMVDKSLLRLLGVGYGDQDCL